MGQGFLVFSATIQVFYKDPIEKVFPGEIVGPISSQSILNNRLHIFAALRDFSLALFPGQIMTRDVAIRQIGWLHQRAASVRELAAFGKYVIESTNISFEKLGPILAIGQDILFPGMRTPHAVMFRYASLAGRLSIVPTDIALPSKCCYLTLPQEQEE